MPPSCAFLDSSVVNALSNAVPERLLLELSFAARVHMDAVVFDQEFQGLAIPHARDLT